MKLKKVGTLIRCFPKHEGRDRHQGFKRPHGKLEVTFDEAMVAGCIQAEDENLRERFIPIMGLTGMNPCDGCPIWQDHGPECECFQKHHSAFRAIVQHVEGAKIMRRVRSRCPTCGLRIRGDNHESHCKGKVVK